MLILMLRTIKKITTCKRRLLFEDLFMYSELDITVCFYSCCDVCEAF